MDTDGERPSVLCLDMEFLLSRSQRETVEVIECETAQTHTPAHAHTKDEVITL